MSAVDVGVDGAPKSATKKKSKKGKKKANGSGQQNDSPAQLNGTAHVAEEADEDDGSQSPSVSASHPVPASLQSSENAQNGVMQPRPPAGDSLHMQSARPEPASIANHSVSNGASQGSQDGRSHEKPDNPEEEDGDDEEEDAEAAPEAPVASDTTARLDAMQQERNALKAEITQLRESLESLQKKHSDELDVVKNELQETSQGKEHVESQYKTLLGRVNQIRAQLGERLKADAAELDTAREKIEELEASNKTAAEENERLQERTSQLTTKVDSQSAEIENLRTRANLSTGNWTKERDDLIQREAYIREEYEVAKQAMQDWEILATEERSRREALGERVQELEDQLSGQRDAYDRVKGEAETQSTTVDGLQRALRDLQDERKRELREMVEQTQAQLDALRAQAKAAEDAAADLRTQLDTAQEELQRAAPFEKEVKEKNLLIGKLRHEAVILNDHLTKALRFLKRGKPEDNVDRHIVTNHFLHFLQLDRSDPKKFQVLQLIAALLAWDEQQREQAGILRPGSGFSMAGGSLRVPTSPFRRTPSTPALSGDFSPLSPTAEGGRESLAELWSDFLEREAESGSGAGSGHSRRPSVARSVGSPSLAGNYSGIMSPARETIPPRSPDLRRKESSSQAASAAAAAMRPDSSGSIMK